MAEPMPGTVAWHPRRGALHAAPLEQARAAAPRIEQHPGVELHPARWER